MKAQLTLLSTVLVALQVQAAKPEKAVQYNHSSPLVIAVIDTGADVNHKDLKEFIWTNPGETGLDKFGKQKSSNGIDDDKNGYVDDVHGWNFVEDNNNVIDDNGHGTHIAGIIKNEFKKHVPVPTGEAKLMILKYYSPNSAPLENAQNTVRAIEYATKMNVKIINYSAGGEEFFAKEFEAIKKAQEQNILFIAAAGNNRKNTNLSKYYPANYPLQNIISVAATDKDGKLGAFSNYGTQSVDLAAPGTSVYSTLPNNRHGFMSGTSQATAYVTGIAAGLMLKDNPPQKTQSVLNELLTLGRISHALKGKTKFQVAIGSDRGADL